MVEKYHSGGFNDPEAEGTPTFFLDGEVTSEIVVDEGSGCMLLWISLSKNNPGL